MEKWNIGMSGVRAEINHFNCEKLLQTHQSITPLFQHSIIPIGAKPLTCFFDALCTIYLKMIIRMNKK